MVNYDEPGKDMIEVCFNLLLRFLLKNLRKVTRNVFTIPVFQPRFEPVASQLKPLCLLA
jgi:hypothetical protein